MIDEAVKDSYPPKPSPSDDEAAGLAVAVQTAINAVAAMCGVHREDFWQSFPGDDSQFNRWTKGNAPQTTDRLIALFERDEVASDFKPPDGAHPERPTWAKLHQALEPYQSLASDLKDFKARVAEWEGRKRASDTAALAAAAHERLQKIKGARQASSEVKTGQDSLRMLSAAFAAPPDDVLTALAWDFLRGEPPTPVTAVHAAVRRADVESVVETCKEPGRVIILHGPVGEGASTAVLQAAHDLVQAERPVLRIRYSFDLDGVGEEIARLNSPPVVLIEDCHDLAGAPAWMAALMNKGGTLLIGTQTRRLERFKALFDQKQVRPIALGPVLKSDTRAFVENLDRFAPTPDANRSALFQDGLSLSHGNGGLWPAQYQATRGEALDHRINIVVNDFDPRLQPLLACLVVMGWSHDQQADIGEPSWSRVLALYEALDDIRPDLRQNPVALLDDVVRALDGEFFAGRSWSSLTTSNDPTLTLRHRAVTESLFRWLFGANRQERGAIRFRAWSKWHYLIAAATRAADDKDDGRAFAFVRLIERSHAHDAERSGLKTRLTGGGASEPGDFLLQAIVNVYGPASAWRRRRLDIMSARLWALGQWGRRTTPAERESAFERTVAVVASAWADKDFLAVCQAAVILERLDRRYDAGDAEYSGRELFAVAAEWETVKLGQPSVVAFHQLKLLAKKTPYGADQVVQAAQEAQFLMWRDWDEERLEVLQDLITCARQGKTASRLGMGMPLDVFGRSRRSLYTAFLIELRRVEEKTSARGQRSLFTPGDGLHSRVASVLRQWASDEETCDDDWPQGLLTRLEDAAQGITAISLSALTAYAGELQSLQRS